MTATLACASHLLVDLPLFGGPVVFVIAAIVLVGRSDRKQRQAVTQPEASRPWPGQPGGTSTCARRPKI